MAPRLRKRPQVPAERYLTVAAIEPSPREREIVRLVAQGLSNKQIGAVLNISPWTVNSHMRRLFAKCSVRSRAALVASALLPDPLSRIPPPPQPRKL